MYLTCIDKFTKYAIVKQIKSRTWVDIKEALGEIFLFIGKPKKIVCDNEPSFNTLSIQNFFSNQGVEVHFTTPNNKSSNGDIERFHNTLNEHLRIIMMKPDNEKQFLSPVLEALSHYNKTKHSATGFKPIYLEFEQLQDELINKVINNLKEKQDKNISKINLKREEREADPRFIKIKERNKIRPLYRKINGTVAEDDDDYIIDKKKRRHYKAVFKKRKKRFNY